MEGERSETLRTTASVATAMLYISMEGERSETLRTTASIATTQALLRL